MMRRSGILSVLFLLALMGGLVAFAPLSFVMRHSGLAERGLGWQQARGSVWQGQVTGMSWRGVPIGSLNLEAHLLRALTGAPVHDVVWSGQQGQGRAAITTNGKKTTASRVSLRIPVTEQIGADAFVASLGATLNVSSGRIRATGRKCDAASGQVSSDLARRAAATFGRDWPVLSGALTCEDGRVGATLSGEASDGTQITMVLDLQDGIEIRLARVDDEVRAVAVAAGFMDQDGALVYTRRPSATETRP